MDVSKMKKMVVLKDLPSNIVDEAFVVLKTNKKVKKLEKIENNKKFKTQDESKNDKEYVLKEDGYSYICRDKGTFFADGREFQSLSEP